MINLAFLYNAKQITSDKNNRKNLNYNILDTDPKNHSKKNVLVI